MALGEKIEQGLQAWRRFRLGRQPGPLGDYHRAGGNELLFRGLRILADEWLVDGGGYRGDFTAEALWRFGCRSLIYEPVPQFAGGLRERFGMNSRVEVIEAALGGADGTASLGFAGDGTSSFRSGGEILRARKEDVLAAWQRLPAIGCLKLNIEGGEFEVLERLCSRGLVAKARTLLIQFHRVTETSEAERMLLQEALSSTHQKRWDHPVVWERWDRRDSGEA